MSGPRWRRWLAATALAAGALAPFAGAGRAPAAPPEVRGLELEPHPADAGPALHRGEGC